MIDNKYQEALEYIRAGIKAAFSYIGVIDDMMETALKILEELVYKLAIKK